LILPVVITVYADKSFTFILKSPPVPVLIKTAASLAKASQTPGRETIASITKTNVKEIAEQKMQDLNTDILESAMRMVEGTARSMGIEIVEG